MTFAAALVGSVALFVVGIVLLNANERFRGWDRAFIVLLAIAMLLGWLVCIAGVWLYLSAD